jgi:hypothetical protein
MCQSCGTAAALVVLLTVGGLSGCSSNKQVPFGLEEPAEKDAIVETEEEATEEEAIAEMPVGETFEPNQVEVPIDDVALVLPSGYALGALRLDLDGEEPTDAIVVSTDEQRVTIQTAFEKGLGVTASTIDSFLVPDDCKDPRVDLRQLSSSLVTIRVDHACEAGDRTNVWILTVERQPRVRERMTLLPPNDVSKSPVSLELAAEDRDADGYEDVVANVSIGAIEVPLTWLNRPGGFARDTSEPEASMKVLADDAWGFIDADPAGSSQRARGVVDAFVALCRESGSARLGLAGTQGIQCGASKATSRAIATEVITAIRRGAFIRALELQRWWSTGAVQPTAEERSAVQTAWQRAKASGNAAWTLVDTQSATARLEFRDEDHIVVGGFAPKLISITTKTKEPLAPSDALPATRSPNGRLAVKGVRVTCVGYEAEIGPLMSKRTHRVVIERRPGTVPCRTPIDRPASVFEWAVLGWAPQGLVAATGDRLRIVPVDELGKTAGQPIDLRPGSPLPAPVRGARITPDGNRYVIPHPEGIVVREWQRGGSGLWLRPADWTQVPGELRAIAISPSGKRIAVQKGNEIRGLTW